MINSFILDDDILANAYKFVKYAIDNDIKLKYTDFIKTNKLHNFVHGDNLNLVSLRNKIILLRPNVLYYTIDEFIYGDWILMGNMKRGIVGTSLSKRRVFYVSAIGY